MNVSIVIPAFNEEQGVGPVISELRTVLAQHGINAEILVIDDGSSDRTAQAAAAAGARVFRHRSNRGYGAALKSGISAASNDAIVITDADGTYPCQYIPEMLNRLETADMVVGARTGANVKIPAIRRPAKWVLNQLANYLTRTKIPDLNSGLRAFRRDVAMQYFAILPDQFSWTTTITLAMHCDKYAVVYMPIDYRARKGKSKIVPWDAGSFAVLILRTAMLFRPLRIFIPVVLLCLLYAIVKMSIDMTRDPNISASALLAFVSALLILLIGMLGDALATRLGRLSSQITGVRTADLIEEPSAKSADSQN
ncbi:MAG: glycosyltransferase family 2 protein [Bryobacterales bacterium]|nr:glycosyltransferase family 2 protein [Bryobacterales bacterium]MBV9397097.1 glycosyltransferase family 2 protein [Bryobacterales bacterium]